MLPVGFVSCKERFMATSLAPLQANSLTFGANRTGCQLHSLSLSVVLLFHRCYSMTNDHSHLGPIARPVLAGLNTWAAARPKFYGRPTGQPRPGPLAACWPVLDGPWASAPSTLRSSPRAAQRPLCNSKP